MTRVMFPRICLAVALASQLSMASSQVPSNYISLDQMGSSGRAATHSNGVRASTYREGEPSAPSQSVHAGSVIEESAAEEADENTDPDTISNQPLDGVTATASGIAFTGEPIVALGSDPVRAYTAQNYPGVSRGAIQRVKDTQAEYAESLASQDVINILGRPFSQMGRGSGQCANGQSGQLSASYYLIREGPFPKSMAVVLFCADGMQRITVQSLR